MASASIGELIYLIGGCTADQTCVPNDPLRYPPNNGYCQCPSSTTSVLVYNPALDSYNSTVVARMPRPRYRHDACAVGGKIWLFGGRTMPDANGYDSIIREVDVLDTATGKWSANVATYPDDLGSDNSCVTLGAVIYLMGGYSNDYSVVFNTTYRYDPTSAQFTRMAGRMLQARGDFSSITAPYPGGGGGTVIRAWGGYTNASSDLDSSWYCRPLATTEFYDPVKDAWSAGPPLPLALAVKDDGIDIDGTIYSLGGEVKAQLVGCEYYDLTAVPDVFALGTSAGAAWTSVTSLPAPRMRSSSAFVGSIIYNFGGQGEFVNDSTLQFFPLQHTAWALQVSTPAASTNVGAIVGGVIGGLAGVALLAAAVVYAVRRRAAQKSLTPATSGAAAGGVSGSDAALDRSEGLKYFAKKQGFRVA